MISAVTRYGFSVTQEAIFSARFVEIKAYLIHLYRFIQQVHIRPVSFLIHGLVYMAPVGNVPVYCFYGGGPLSLVPVPAAVSACMKLFIVILKDDPCHLDSCFAYICKNFFFLNSLNVTWLSSTIDFIIQSPLEV